MPDNTKRHAFAKQAHALALGALRYQVLVGRPGSERQEAWDLRALAHVGAAQAIKEAWQGRLNRASDSCVKWHNWVGISAVGDQPWAGGANGEHIRKFMSDESCWLSWAWLMLDAPQYEEARDVLDKCVAWWLERMPTAASRAYKKFALVMAQTYCESDAQYGHDLLSIMDEIEPVVFAVTPTEGKTTET